MMQDYLLALAVSAAASAIACRFMIAVGVTDTPDLARKMHDRPTTTSGGLGVAIGVALGLAALTFPAVRVWSLTLLPSEALRLASAAGIAFIFLAIGFWDDARPLRAGPKLLLFAVAAIAASLLVGQVAQLPISDNFVIALPLPAALVGSALWVFVLVNAVNFMDGANGLAMGSSAIGLGFLALLAYMLGAQHAAALALVGVGALAGFLLWNFPDGRLFAGDAGALFAGAIAATAGLIVIEDGGASPFTVTVLFFPLLADALLTLAWRVGRRRNVLEGHREHVFQVLMRSGWTHAQATLAYWIATVLCGLAALAAAFAAHQQWLYASSAPFSVFVVSALAALVMSWRVRVMARRQGLDREA